ncbi:MAG TPA: M48 family metalloprotease [Rhodospirillales bacterium]|nr:M48 family metalloprotease [Rhodospirillales bacterium]
MSRNRFAFAFALALIAPLTGCSVNPATGERSFTGFMSPEDEKRVGAEQHPHLVRRFGGEYGDAELEAYVQKVGASLAAQGEVPELSYTFTVLDDEMINAFALPGGYVHITRGLMALADNEAEMASVLGHELGHITARHAAQRYSQSIATNIGVGLLGVLGAVAGLPTGTADIAGLGAQVYLQSYSRDQELEADELGIRYMTRAGYDPAAMATFFRKLDAYTQLQAALIGAPDSGDRLNIMASHPRTADRAAQAVELAAAQRVTDGRWDRDRYLAAIDGMLYGDSPQQGVRRGRTFAHPDLGIAFEGPPGFVMFISPNQVTARGPGGSLIVFDSAGADEARAAGSMTRYVGSVGNANLRFGNLQALDVGGMEAATGATRVNTRGGPMDVRMVAIRERPERIYRFLFLTPPQATERLGTDLQRTTYSFRRLSAAEAAAIRPMRIEVVTVRSGDTMQSLASRMATPLPLETFRAINGFGAGERLQPGREVKIITK